jgi:hypothetical protein
MKSYYFTIQGKKVNWHSTLLLFDSYLIFETLMPIKIEGKNLKNLLDSIEQLNANIKNGKFYFDKVSNNLSFKMTKQFPFNPIEELLRKISKG